MIRIKKKGTTIPNTAYRHDNTVEEPFKKLSKYPDKKAMGSRIAYHKLVSDIEQSWYATKKEQFTCGYKVKKHA